jgi:uncharacterized phage-associated protein
MAKAEATNSLDADISKIKAAILYLLKVSGGKMAFFSFFGIMYFIQKEYLVRYGKTLFNEPFFACDLGPFPLFTYNCFRCIVLYPNKATDTVKRFCSSFTYEGIGNVRYVYAKEVPDMNELSAAEIRVIDRVVKKYEGQSFKQLKEEMCDYAWEKAMERAAKNPEDNGMFLVDIARAGGASVEKFNYILRKYAFYPYCRE